MRFRLLNHKDCKHELISDFSFYEIGSDKKTKHILCHDCGYHWFRDKIYSPSEWEKYINE